MASTRSARSDKYLDNLQIFGNLTDLCLFCSDGTETNFLFKEHN